jgi:hypothetical protein
MPPPPPAQYAGTIFYHHNYNWRTKRKFKYVLVASYSKNPKIRAWAKEGRRIESEPEKNVLI